jgi:hypothetical protein
MKKENSIYFTSMINNELVVWDPYYMATNINKLERIQWQAARSITANLQDTIFMKMTKDACCAHDIQTHNI